MSLFDRHKATNLNIFSSGASAENSHAQHTQKMSAIRDSMIESDAHHNEVMGLYGDIRHLSEAFETAEALGLERRAINAGLRAVVREALKVLKTENPDHPLLDKKVRQRLFEQYEKQEFDAFIDARNKAGEKTSHVIAKFPRKPAEHILEDI